ncbi:MAG: hypothetical protein OMOMHJEC_02815 [Xanthomonadales bacterium]|nr:hypothetical protein [Xanthomonadales bacterium]
MAQGRLHRTATDANCRSGARLAAYTRRLNDRRLDMLEILRELWSFLRIRKKYWLMPIVLVLVVIGGILVAVKGSVIAPFLYTLF